MNTLPRSVEALIQELGKLPGVGRRSAERLAFHLLHAERERALALAGAIQRVKDEIGLCETCHFLAEGSRCAICADSAREESVICVVEQSLDVIAFERAGGFHGRYHVLGGRLSPLRGVSPEDLAIADLTERAASPQVEELILATSPSLEGDATAHYLQRRLESTGKRITRLGRGVPSGSSLEHSDPATLRAALEGRRPLGA